MKQQEIRLLACDEEVLNEADDILGDELAKLNRYSRYCFTPTEIGKSFGIEGRDLNSFLADRGVIRWSGGRRQLRSSLVWTEKGRQFIGGLIWRQ